MFEELTREEIIYRVMADETARKHFVIRRCDSCQSAAPMSIHQQEAAEATGGREVGVGGADVFNKTSWRFLRVRCTSQSSAKFFHNTDIKSMNLFQISERMRKKTLHAVYQH